MDQIIARLEAFENVLRTTPRENTINGLVIILPDATVIPNCELLKELIALLKEANKVAA